MKLISSRPFWPMRDGLPATYPPLGDNVRCDVAIIGGGISGALMGRELVAAGVDAVLLDRREVAHGSTAASTSLLQYELDEPLHRLTQRIGRERAERCYSRCRDALEELEAIAVELDGDCGFERRASLLLASGRAHLVRLRREFVARKEAGFSVDWWSREEVSSRSSLPHPAAILSHDGAQVDAYLLTYGLLRAVSRAGLRVYDRTAVTRTRFHGRGVELHTNRGYWVRARHLVVATGFEAEELLRRKITTLHSTYALASEPVLAFAGWPAERALIWETARPYIYLRTTSDGRVIIGGYDEPFRDPAARDRLLPAKTTALKRRFAQLFPAIPIEVACSWAGTFADTPGGLPFIGQHREVPRVWFALGYGGNGITFSVIAAQVIRDGILGNKNRDADLFGYARFIE